MSIAFVLTDKEKITYRGKEICPRPCRGPEPEGDKSGRGSVALLGSLGFPFLVPERVFMGWPMAGSRRSRQDRGRSAAGRRQSAKGVLRYTSVNFQK